MSTERDNLLTLNDEDLCRRCRISFTRGTGPGGQKRNKTSSAVRLELPELELVATDCTERSQFRNRANALRKLRLAIARRYRESPAAPPETPVCALTSPSYPLWLAHLLDVLAEANWDHRTAAAVCGMSPTALIKKLYRDPPVWQELRRRREAAGLPPLTPP